MKKLELNEQINRSLKLMSLLTESVPPFDFVSKIFPKLDQSEMKTILSAVESKIRKKLTGGLASLRHEITSGTLITEKQTLEIIVNVFKNTEKNINILVDIIKDATPNFTLGVEQAIKNGATREEIVKNIPELGVLPEDLLDKYLTNLGHNPLPSGQSGLKVVKSLVSGDKSVHNSNGLLFKKKPVMFGLWKKFMLPDDIEKLENQAVKKYAGKPISFVESDIKQMINDLNSSLVGKNLSHLTQSDKKTLLDVLGVSKKVLDSESGKQVTNRYKVIGVKLIGTYVLIEFIRSILNKKTFIGQAIDYYNKTKTDVNGSSSTSVGKYTHDEKGIIEFVKDNYLTSKSSGQKRDINDFTIDITNEGANVTYNKKTINLIFSDGIYTQK